MARSSINIVWFKRDLRLRDHAPLKEAVAAGKPVLLLYVFEPSLMEHPCSDLRHWRFVWQSLKDMQEASRLNFGITVCHHEAELVFRQLLRFYEIDTVFSHEEIGVGLTFERDKRLAAFFRSRGICWQESPSGAVRRGLRSREGWVKHWHDFMKAEQASFSLEALQALLIRLADAKPAALQAVKGKALPRSIKLATPEGMQAGGESKALLQLQAFMQSQAKGYLRSISSPTLARFRGSRLSAYIAWGNLSMRQVFQAYKEAQKESPAFLMRDLKGFGSRLRWQGHFIQRFESACNIEFENLNAAFDELDWEFDQQRFEAWKSGKTGFPLVDACMNCLRETGFLNFRMRAMLVSFACHYLWLPWQPVAHFLAGQFLDFEPGIHYSQIQMQAGVTGINTIRIYNPVKQAKDLDADAHFVMKWLPQFKGLPLNFILEPWTLRPLEQLFYNFQLGKDYPYPIVDAKKAHQRSRDKIWEIHNSNKTQQLNAAILEKHVERKKAR